MKKFEIIVNETLERVVEILADTEEEAIELVRFQYNNGSIVLDSNDFIGVDYIKIGEDDIDEQDVYLYRASKEIEDRLKTGLFFGTEDEYNQFVKDCKRNFYEFHAEGAAPAEIIIYDNGNFSLMEYEDAMKMAADWVEPNKYLWNK